MDSNIAARRAFSARSLAFSSTKLVEPPVRSILESRRRRSWRRIPGRPPVAADGPRAAGLIEPCLLNSFTTADTVVRESPVTREIAACVSGLPPRSASMTRSRFRSRSSWRPRGAVDGISTATSSIARLLENPELAYRPPTARRSLQHHSDVAGLLDWEVD